MAAIAKQAGPVAYPSGAAAIAPITFVAGTVTGSGGDLVDITGNTILIAHNTSADTEYDLIITGTELNGRTITITEPMAFGTMRVIGPFPGPGWATAAGKLAVSVENAAILLAAVELHP